MTHCSFSEMETFSNSTVYIGHLYMFQRVPDTGEYVPSETELMPPHASRQGKPQAESGPSHRAWTSPGGQCPLMQVTYPVPEQGSLKKPQLCLHMLQATVLVLMILDFLWVLIFHC